MNSVIRAENLLNVTMDILAKDVTNPGAGVELAHSVYDYNLIQIKQVNGSTTIFSSLFSINHDCNIYVVPFWVYACEVTINAETNIRIRNVDNSANRINPNSAYLYSVYGYKFID